jgi:hypothetical protein
MNERMERFTVSSYYTFTVSNQLPHNAVGIGGLKIENDIEELQNEDADIIDIPEPITVACERSEMMRW